MGHARVLSLALLLIMSAACSPAPQAEEGNGWRLLASKFGVGTAYDTSVFTSEGELRMFWLDYGLSGEIPTVDWDTEIVLHFGPSVGSECPTHHLRALHVEESVVFPEIERDPKYDGCTDDMNPFTFLVAYDRAQLPATPFTVELRSEACVKFENPDICKSERTEVNAAQLEHIPRLALDSITVDQAMQLWWNATGLVRDDPVVWEERLSEMCHRGVWDQAVAVALGEKYQTQDLPVSGRADGIQGPSSDEVARTLTIMGLSACRNAYPPDAVPAGP